MTSTLLYVLCASVNVQSGQGLCSLHIEINVKKIAFGNTRRIRKWESRFY